jgi:hypothetical protein
VLPIRREYVAFSKESRVPSNDKQQLTKDEIKNLLGAPPLIRGESEESYWNWWEAFVAQHEPESLTDWLEVDQLATKHWEQERLRRSNAALLDGVLVQALASLLAVYSSNRVTDDLLLDPMWFIDPFPLARNYYSGEGLMQDSAREIVAAYGITDDQIIAKATKKCSDAMIQFDRMDSYRTNAKRALLKELDRRSESRRVKLVISESGDRFEVDGV